jgi:hypothetical protein
MLRLKDALQPDVAQRTIVHPAWHPKDLLPED